MMRRIFISYARQDGLEIAQALADRLRAVGYTVFLDLQSMVGGTQWQPELARQVRQADFLVVLITEHANDSDYVYQEIMQAQEHKKPIIPVQVGEAALPVHLRGTWQAIAYDDHNIDRLVVEIQRSAMALRPARTSTRGVAWPLLIVIGLLGLVIGGAATWLVLRPSAPTGSAPIITDVVIREETSSDGQMTLWQDLYFTDADGDAFVVDWELVSNTSGPINMDDISAITVSDAQKTGAVYVARWVCGTAQDNLVLAATLYDKAGHRSNRYEYPMMCN